MKFVQYEKIYIFFVIAIIISSKYIKIVNSMIYVIESKKIRNVGRYTWISTYSCLYNIAFY